MHHLILFFTIWLLFLGCKQFSTSKEEMAALKSISDIYGGRCSISRIKGFSSGQSAKKILEIEVDNSVVIKSYAQYAEIFAGNIAVIAYENVRLKVQYDLFRSIIKFSEGEQSSFEFKTDLLELVTQHKKTLQLFADALAKQDSAKTTALLKSCRYLSADDIAPFYNHIMDSDNKFGKVIGWDFGGFRFTKNEDGLKYLHLSGKLHRTRQDMQFSVDLNPKPGSNEIYMFNFNF